MGRRKDRAYPAILRNALNALLTYEEGRIPMSDESKDPQTGEELPIVGQHFLAVLRVAGDLQAAAFRRNGVFERAEVVNATAIELYNDLCRQTGNV